MIDKDLRYEIIEQIYPIVQSIWDDVCVYESLNYAQIYAQDIEDYFSDTFNIEFTSSNFDIVSKHKIAGMILVDNEQRTIAFDGNSTKTRQYFTKMHEIAHFVFDINKNRIAMFEQDREPNGETTFEELRAEITAEMLMISDYALLECLVNEKNWNYIRNAFQISQSALSYRIQDFFVYNMKMNPYSAYTECKKYMNSDKHQLFDLAKVKYAQILRDCNDKTRALAILEIDNDYFINNNGKNRLISHDGLGFYSKYQFNIS